MSSNSSASAPDAHMLLSVLSEEAGGCVLAVGPYPGELIFNCHQHIAICYAFTTPLNCTIKAVDNFNWPHAYCRKKPIAADTSQNNNVAEMSLLHAARPQDRGAQAWYGGRGDRISRLCGELDCFSSKNWCSMMNPSINFACFLISLTNEKATGVKRRILHLYSLQGFFIWHH